MRVTSAMGLAMSILEPPILITAIAQSHNSLSDLNAEVTFLNCPAFSTNQSSAEEIRMSVTSSSSKSLLTGSRISIKQASTILLLSDDSRQEDVERIRAILAVKRPVKLRGPGLWGE